MLSRTLLVSCLLVVSTLLAACGRTRGFDLIEILLEPIEGAGHPESVASDTSTARTPETQTQQAVPTQVQQTAPIPTIRAKDWVALYEKNAIMADKKVGGQTVRVIGRVLEFETTGLLGEETLRLKIGNDGLSQVVNDPVMLELATNGSLLGMGLASAAKNETYSMYLEFDATQKDKLAALSKGDAIAAICVAETGVPRGKQCVIDSGYQFPSAQKSQSTASSQAQQVAQQPSDSSSVINQASEASVTAVPTGTIQTSADPEVNADGLPLGKDAKKVDASIFKQGDDAAVPPESELNLRAAPNVQSDLVAQLRRNAKLKVLGDTAVRHEDGGRQTQWLTVELYDGDFCLPAELGKQATCAYWSSVNPHSSPQPMIRGWVNQNKIIPINP